MNADYLSSGKKSYCLILIARCRKPLLPLVFLVVQSHCHSKTEAPSVSKEISNTKFMEIVAKLADRFSLQKGTFLDPPETERDFTNTKLEVLFANERI